ncbi:hypothetical protein DPMN_129877 [Dreissena polymorpha]|uniref:Uncharacterized protein n=1 Tax=Dreissena polymorpha TaxID=45954 RepID=A0A9D4JXU3_DREPO|nr:hypothetical protein DPMN_129877 [Dreissena polymorpha]
MSDNNIRDWTVGLKFTQQQNCSHHAGINQTHTMLSSERTQRLDLPACQLISLKDFNVRMI